MKKAFGIIQFIILLYACNGNDIIKPKTIENPEVALNFPSYFPALNRFFKENRPTKYGVELGKKLFHDKRLSADNTISCSSCHMQEKSFADGNKQAIGISGKVGLRNVPPIQNMAFTNFYMWDGNVWDLKKQVLIPIITKEEMASNILEVIGKIKNDHSYKNLFKKTFGDEEVTQERIFESIAQYEYTLISANSKYDKVKRNEGILFTAEEQRGYKTFQEKCISCHDTELFTDQTFRNIGFPVNIHPDEAGRARVTGVPTDYMAFRVPSLRNVEYTAPYGSFGQFATLKEVLDYFDNGVINSNNLDPIFKDNNNRIPLTEQEKTSLITFMKTLSDSKFISNP